MLKTRILPGFEVTIYAVLPSCERINCLATKFPRPRLKDERVLFTVGVQPEGPFAPVSTWMMSIVGGVRASTLAAFGSVLIKTGVAVNPWTLPIVLTKALSQVRLTVTDGGAPPAMYANAPSERNETARAGAARGMVFSASNFE